MTTTKIDFNAVAWRSSLWQFRQHRPPKHIPASTLSTANCCPATAHGYARS